MYYKDIFTKEFGPVLYALGDSCGHARYRVLFYSQSEPACIVDKQDTLKATLLKTMPQGCFWTFDFSVAQESETSRHIYAIDGKEYAFIVPGENTERLRIAYASCNGSEAEPPFRKPFPGRNALWEHMAETHTESAYHLLVHGGDQLYADSVWNDIPFLVEWKALPRSRQYTADIPDDVFMEIRNYYFACYMSNWSRTYIKLVLSAIPSVMIWDDHDIFDGWGSWNNKYQASPVYQAVFKAAREAFYLFQRGCPVPSAGQTAGMAITLGHSVFILPDLRSERTRTQVMGPIGWKWFEDALIKTGQDKKHLIIVSSVPLATSHFSMLDPILTGFPSFIARRIPKKINPKQFADDIHDQWRVPAHRDEWLRMLRTLLDFAENTDTRVTTLSGEIHLGAKSTIKRRQVVIHQFIASGIAHKPSNAVMVGMCELLSKGVQDIDDEIDVRMEYFFPRSKRKYLRARNWLSVELENDAGITAWWHAENNEPISFKD